LCGRSLYILTVNSIGGLNLYKLIGCLLVVSGLFYNFYNVDKLVTDESKKIKIASDVTFDLIDMVASNIPACVQEYEINGNMQYGDVNYTKVNNWAFKGLELCSTQHLLQA
jgi:hypothetical protein